MKLRCKDVFLIEGVYLLYLNDNVVYCGESKCCISRVNTHWREQAIIFDDFEVIKSSSRKSLEKALIIEYRPMYNKTYNPDHIKPINRKGGRKHGLTKSGKRKSKQCAELYKSSEMTVPEIMKKVGIGSKATFYKYLNIHSVDIKRPPIK